MKSKVRDLILIRLRKDYPLFSEKNSSCLLPVMIQVCIAFCYSSLSYKFFWIKKRLFENWFKKILGLKIFKRITFLIGVYFFLLYFIKNLSPKFMEKNVLTRNIHNKKSIWNSGKIWREKNCRFFMSKKKSDFCFMWKKFGVSCKKKTYCLLPPKKGS